MDSKPQNGTATSMECGSEAIKQHFCFDPKYKNLNHGSFGTYPKPVRAVLRSAQDECEARPDTYIRYTFGKNLDVSREAVSKIVHAPVEACVFVPNATTGVNTVLRSLVYEPKDVIFYFDTIYGACEKTVIYLTETTHAEARKVEYTYPLSDEALCDAFEKAISEVKAAGKNPKVAIFDSIVSMPGLRMPFEQLTKLCKKHGLLSLIDGAHCVGHISIDLQEIDPDFFVSNLHKWLFVPRGCALLYVPVRNQHLIRSTLPTSHGFQPLPTEGAAIKNPLPPSRKNAFVTNFEFVGTIDNSPYMCVPAAIEFRKAFTWQGRSGEDAIIAFTEDQAKKAGQVVSGILGTEILDNEAKTLTKCNFANIRLPLDFEVDASGDGDKAIEIAQWLSSTLNNEYDTFIAILVYNNAWWARLSAQVYLDMSDWEWAGHTLKEVCGRVQKGQALEI
ncbi:hypothetical protein AAFC00_002209 [Neodothiora populina]|uniref:Aminotransferase class V domain-containing protein n=1 Tax=Neodothiora populina TaxID=2781224 RepID=A0ABR3PGN5_9PEZI